MSDRKLSPVQKVLLDAADYIEEHGHCKGMLWYQGRVCVRGAINVVVGDGPPYFSKLSDEEAALTDKVFCNLEEYLGKDPISWNNAPERSKEDVIAALRGAAGLANPA